jgi:transposase
MCHLFAFQHEVFLARYHQRSNVETTFSMSKTKFGGALRSKSEVGQFNEVLYKVVAHILCVLVACIREIGLEAPAFSSAS